MAVGLLSVGFSYGSRSGENRHASGGAAPLDDPIDEALSMFSRLRAQSRELPLDPTAE
jgi:hypothetical protein